MSGGSAVGLAIGANLLFWSSLFVFAALRSDGYAHATKAVSELGVWGAPNMWAFNILGYVLPGFMLAACGRLIGRAARSSWLAVLLALAGAFVTVAGVFPADMSDYASFTTVGHLAGSTGSVIAWALGMLVAIVVARKRWVALAALSAVALALMIGAFFLYETLPSGIVQRLTFGVFFAYFLVAALLLWRRARAHATD